ncbi:MAG: cyclic pyranopterin phosphate synthase [Chitinophagales bacterium]|mgnify:CR=1 FL=1|jgi:cyclic pyranopterin phosphate synthase
MNQTIAQYPNKLIDRFGRHINYVRLSVTDRCDFRCVYCMAEEMTFLPRKEILSLEEIEIIARVFTELGVNKIRLTGGEPLIRKGVLGLTQKLGALTGLEELTITTNGSQLATMADDLKQAGIKRINISLDTLKADRFKSLTRTGDLLKVRQGIDAALAAGFERIKINAVLLKGRNDDEAVDLVNFCRKHNLDISFIEEMPLGVIDEHDRAVSYLSSDELKKTIEQVHTLTASSDKTGGPSKYYRMSDSDIKVGFISPHSHNFCGDCNRVRVTVEGKLLLCLGNEHSVDLRAILRQPLGDASTIKDAVKTAIVDSMTIKPERHYFDLDNEPQIVRFMNATGG